MSKLLSTLKRAGLAAVAGTVLLSAGSAHAGLLLNQEPDASLIVRAGGYEWVYASPCGGGAGSCDLVVRHHGFDFATAEQWNASFASLQALSAAFTPNGGVLCASTYFSTNYNHCDTGDILAGYVWGAPFAPGWGAQAGTSETFLVRAIAQSDVPEPATLALTALGLAAVVASRRKRAR
ncbi:PEP-CTERM sorting domain-containing protein [Massilia sp. YIM B02769]|jgi:PEP-CTERM motif|uniref:PEP-CTERM sorting domain-containing protein n=1 Tax=unclassified Massilia TaxID=2609279 RepID=UPI0025B6BE36|nr:MULTISPECIES: PEP-CTERM sorting domain-containing protein [unclassified Massilia]MDN4056643.1 PEP-CTERM sorting domain-containing protein [Massilia sp. YIM B02769]